MDGQFPAAVPEVPVSDITRAAGYYEKCLGFAWDWGVDGIGQVSRGDCRIFLTDDGFRGEERRAPVVIWLNLDSRTAVDELHGTWRAQGARIAAAPEPKPWNLYEFSATDSDGNTIRVFYDFAWELPDRGGRKDDAAERAHVRAQPRVTSLAPQFLVDDLERSMAYYRKIGFNFDEPWDGFYAIGRLDGLELHLKEAPKNLAERGFRREHEHLDAAVGVDGIEAFYERCVAAGASVLRPLAPTEWGTKDFYLEDPDGYIIAFGGRAPERQESVSQPTV